MKCEQRGREGKHETLPVIRRPGWGVLTQLPDPGKRCPSSTLSLSLSMPVLGVVLGPWARGWPNCAELVFGRELVHVR